MGLAVGAGCQAGGLFELAGKIGEIIVPALRRHLSYALVRLGQQHLGAVDTQSDGIADQAVPGLLFEYMGDIVFVQVSA